MRDLFNKVILLGFMSLLLALLNVALVSAGTQRARIRKHATKYSTDVLKDSLPNQDDKDYDLNNGHSQLINTDLVDKMSWNCSNNASCLYALVNGAYKSYERGETVKIGPIDLFKLPPVKNVHEFTNNKDQTESGRAMSSFVDFMRGNAIRIPFGPMVFSVQRADDDDNYIEVALLKKSVDSAARNQGAAKQGGSGVGGGLLGGTGSGGGGGGILGGGLIGGGGEGSGIGGGGGIMHRRRQHHEKKQFQMYIPLYLAATTFGWTLVAAKAVGLLTLKALAVSKIAFIVAASIIVKKLMDSASEKLLYQYPEHAPYMMPYNMEYPMHSMGSEMANSDMFHPSALQLAAASPMQHQGHMGLESYGAESHLHHNIADVQNNTQVLAALNAAGLGQKVKREDAWIARSKFSSSNGSLKNILSRKRKRNFLHNEPLAISAALVTAEEIAEAHTSSDEEDLQDTLKH